MNQLKILFAASEVVPFAKSGGLADVAGALPKALSSLGHDIRVVMPRYYVIDREKYNLKMLDGALGVPMGPLGEQWAAVYEGLLPNSDVKVYFIEHEQFFGRAGLYEENGYGYSDNDVRFIFFSRAVMQLAKKLQFHPDVIHANDWHSAAIPVMLNTIYAFDESFAHTGSMFTIHNLQHQGRFSNYAMNFLEIGWQHFNADELEEYDGINLLKGAVVHTDAITTVSPKYAAEITTSEFGWGLHNLIGRYEYKLHGILNGVDYNEWSPVTDKFLAANYDIKTLDKKLECKRDLQREFGLPVRDDIALIGLVGRLVEQKGIELIASKIYDILELDVQIVLLGTGESWAEGFFSHIAGAYPEKFACYIGYRNDLAHKIEAGSDMFLMPSIFEPCGLNQIYSLRYGSVPIVRAAGGLDDTIENYHNDGLHGTGFKFYDATSDALYNTIGWALHTYYNDPKGFRNIQKNGMKKRFDWEVAAKEYERVYEIIKKGRV